jgi:hypothetical protein
LFPLKLGHLSCKSLEDAFCLGSDLLNFNFGFYDSRTSFDSKGIIHCLFSPKEKFLPACHIEDIWEDCEDELEVKKRELSRLSLSQIKLYMPNVDISDIKEDANIPGNHIKDLAIHEKVVINWKDKEEDDIMERTRSIVSRTNEWLKNKKGDKNSEFICNVTILSSIELVESDNLIELVGNQAALKKKRSIKDTSSTPV